MIPEPLLRFLNGLPTTGRLVDAIRLFRDALQELLRDVDRVMVDVNYLCDLNDPEGYAPERAVTQHIGEEGAERVTIAARSIDAPPLERLLAQARAGGFRADEYEEPAGFEYYFAGTAYLGTIVLWRAKGRGKVPAAVTDLMRQLEPFLIHLLSDIVARHNFRRPVDRAFHEALERITAELRLTEREQEVLALHLFGYPYQEIGDTIHIGIDAVRKHVKSIHRKAGVSTYTELFARYFTPRLFLREEEGAE